MIDQARLNAASQCAWERGYKILQSWRLADTDAAHVHELLELMQPRRNSLWVDVGAGFGEVASLMCDERPDLSFFLLNNNRYQIEHSPTDFTWLDADMHDIPLGDATVDGCMYCYSLCHADNWTIALTEAARVTMPGGVLFVYDYERIEGDNELMWEQLRARAYAFERIRSVAEACGWLVTMHAYPEGSDTVFRAGLDEPGERVLYQEIFGQLRPLAWRAVRVGEPA